MLLVHVGMVCRNYNSNFRLKGFLSLSYPATRDGGASRSKKHSLATVARISAPKPHVSGASCVTIHLPVLETDSQIVSLSHGRIETFQDIKMFFHTQDYNLYSSDLNAYKRSEILFGYLS